MFDLTCNYLDDDDIDHEAEKQWIFKTLHRLEKEEEIKSLLNDFSKFSSLYDEAVAAGLKKVQSTTTSSFPPQHQTR